MKQFKSARVVCRLSIAGMTQRVTATVSRQQFARRGRERGRHESAGQSHNHTHSHSHTLTQHIHDEDCFAGSLVCIVKRYMIYELTFPHLLFLRVPWGVFCCLFSFLSRVSRASFHQRHDVVDCLCIQTHAGRHAGRQPGRQTGRQSGRHKQGKHAWLRDGGRGCPIALRVRVCGLFLSTSS